MDEIDDDRKKQSGLRKFIRENLSNDDRIMEISLQVLNHQPLSDQPGIDEPDPEAFHTQTRALGIQDHPLKLEDLRVQPHTQ